MVESVLDRWPFAIEDREPRRITVAPLVDVGLPPDALEGEAEPDCSCPRSGIERIALPSVAAIAKFIKDVPHHQVHCLARRNPTLKCRRVNNPADFDAAGGRVNIQIARLTERLAAREIDQCIFRAYAAGPDGIDPCAQFLGPGTGSPRQVCPEAAFAIRSVGGVQRLPVPGAVDWFDPAVVRSSPQTAAVAWVASLARVARAEDRWTSRSISEPSRSAATVVAALLPHYRSL